MIQRIGASVVVESARRDLGTDVRDHGGSIIEVHPAESGYHRAEFVVVEPDHRLL